MEATPTFYNVQHSNLPTELVDALNQAYFLHLLVTDPAKVVPPGKSLLSMLLHSQLSSQKDETAKTQPLLERVKEVAHKAFWDEAVDSLSNPLPSVQLPRIRRLYNDLYDSLNTLFPPTHRAIVTLQSPLGPTSSPLLSALAFLKELLLALKERCAPVRDNDIDDLYRKLDEWHDLTPFNAQAHDSPKRLASLLVETMKSIVSLADVMKSDLNTAILGSMSEPEVKSLLYRKAKEQERTLVLRLWSSTEEQDGRLLREKWRTWVTELPDSNVVPYGASLTDETRWIPRLMVALESNLPVSCTIVPSQAPPDHTQDQPLAEMPNELPPQFMFASRQLFIIQNYVQALAIAAALRILAGIPAPSRSQPSDAPAGSTFMDRVWPLLQMEVEAEEMGNETPDEATKLVNLADEVVHARRLASPSKTLDAAEESRIRDAVDRTLRPRDPVFILLRRRLIEGLGKQLVEHLASPATTRAGNVPQIMKSGQGRPNLRATKRPRLRTVEADAEDPPCGLTQDDILSFVIKGFEDPVLVKAISAMLSKLHSCVQWFATVWGDMV